METLEVLQKARALVEQPETWTQHTFARNAEGAPRHENWDDDACAFCIRGALNKAVGRHVGINDDCYMAIRNAVGGQALARFNDTPGRSHAEVLAAFDRAIEAARPSCPTSSAEGSK
jgi:hypothetical protein